MTFNLRQTIIVGNGKIFKLDKSKVLISGGGRRDEYFKMKVSV